MWCRSRLMLLRQFVACNEVSSGAKNRHCILESWPDGQPNFNAATSPNGECGWLESLI